ncbi:MAG: hypothetical protein ACOYMA_03760 [Bacteroidia bacterium]
MEFIIEEDASSMTIVEGFLPITNCLLLIANYSNCKEDAYSMTFALGLYHNLVNPKILSSDRFCVK